MRGILLTICALLAVCATCLVLITHAYLKDRGGAQEAAAAARRQAAYAQSMSERQAEIDRLEALLFN